MIRSRLLLVLVLAVGCSSTSNPPPAAPTSTTPAKVWTSPTELAQAIRCSPAPETTGDGARQARCTLASGDELQIVTFTTDDGRASWLAVAQGLKTFSGPGCVIGERWVACVTRRDVNRGADLAIVERAVGGSLWP